MNSESSEAVPPVVGAGVGTGVPHWDFFRCLNSWLREVNGTEQTEHSNSASGRGPQPAMASGRLAGENPQKRKRKKRGRLRDYLKSSANLLYH